MLRSDEGLTQTIQYFNLFTAAKQLITSVNKTKHLRQHDVRFTVEAPSVVCLANENFSTTNISHVKRKGWLEIDNKLEQEPSASIELESLSGFTTERTMVFLPTDINEHLEIFSTFTLTNSAASW